MVSTFALLLALVALQPRSRGAEQSGGLAFYQEKVAPILQANCFKCHSQSAEKIKGGLSLDSREDILKGGDSGPVIEPGIPAKSRLILAVRQTDKDLAMPPKSKLADEEIKTLEEWVRQGAPAPESARASSGPAKMLWSVKPLAPGPAPSVRQKDWPLGVLDSYVLSVLEERGIAPAPAASKQALLRRVSFDLTGLPPSAEMVERFLKDNSPRAYETMVDSLLAEPAFGEHWGRHWLDVARYADSSGLDNNTPFDNAWRYRDYVVNAFNHDKPYNEFIREQLAGDLLPSSSIEQQHELWVATGFLMLGPKPPFIDNPQKILADAVDEQIDVTSKAFLGLTASCARCHDHKFDPIPTQDYYALAGIFQSTTTILLPGMNPARDNKLWMERPLGSKEQIETYEKFENELAKLQQEVQVARQLRQTLPGGIDSKMLDGIVLDNLDAEVMGNWKLSNYSTNFVDKNYQHDGDEKREKGKKLVRFAPQIPEPGFYEVRLAYTARPNRATNVPVRLFATTGLRMISLNQRIEPRYDKAFESLGVFEFPAGTNVLVEVGTENTKGFVVVDAIQFLPQDVQLAARLKRMGNRPPPGMLPGGKMVRATDQQELEYNLMELQTKAPPDVPRAMAVKEGSPQNSKINIRGDVEKLGNEVPRGFLTVVARAVPQGGDGLAKIPLKISHTDQSGRLELADWIANPANPLTPRVMANRIWLHLFGRGLVNTPDNFGTLGDKPSNPELLDYLASSFIQQGWSTKKLIREIVLSRTYQMSSDATPTGEKLDPSNRLFWRMNRKRLQVEEIRDAMLSSNGTLDMTEGGPSLNIATPPPGVPMQAGPVDPLASRRRTVYLPILRNNLPDMLQVFDFADPHTLSGKRYTTTAATQALFMMNSQFVSGQAAAWAEKLLALKATDAGRVQAAFQNAFSRKPSNAEENAALQYLREFGESLERSGKAPAAEARQKQSWQSFCQALYQTTEFRFLD
jgi:hypothetical protein